MKTNPAVNSNFFLVNKPWMLYQFVAGIFNILLHDEEYDPHETSETLVSSFNFKSYNRLHRKLNTAYYFGSAIIISPAQMLSLLTFTDQVFKALFILEYSQLKKTVSEKLNQMKEEWDKAFNDSHENILNAFKIPIDYTLQLTELLKQ